MASKSKKNYDKNYLDYIPVINENYPWKIDDKNIVIIEVIKTGFFDKIAQKIFKVPKKSSIHLDKYGSFVWQLINGERTVYDISKNVSEKFGKEAEPLINRLVQFFRILYDHHFISFRGEDK